MSFRKPKSHRAADQREWLEWLAVHDLSLKAIHLPPSITLSKEHWTDFLQNGYLEWHPEFHDGFVLEQLSLEQMSGLLHLLESSPEYAPMAMTRWLRVRLGRTEVS